MPYNDNNLQVYVPSTPAGGRKTVEYNVNGKRISRSFGLSFASKNNVGSYKKEMEKEKKNG